jgi:predicted TIM-barrel fold metal-dependent hydrolase
MISRYPAFVLSLAILSVVIVLSPPSAPAQEATEPLDVEIPSFREYDPPSTLVVPEHSVTRAKFPFIDVHNHQFGMPTQDLSEVTAAMDELNMAVMVNLSGRGFRRVALPDGSTMFDTNGEDYLQGAVAHSRETAPGRFVVFTNISFADFGTEGWTDRTVAALQRDVANGAQGLKIYKNLGLTVADLDGKRVAVDDSRLDPIWAKCGELGIPVLIHTGEPASFWKPKDGDNERLLELIEKPDRYREPESNPSWEDLMAEQHAIFRRHPGTTFINAHLGWMGNDLDRLGRLLDEMPNVYTEIGAVLAELGRQPRNARRFFIEHQDRVLFGKDSWTPSEYAYYFRVLETDDEYFDYYRRRHGLWKIYGMNLPDDVLKKLYFENALRILPGIDPSAFPE